MQNKIDMGLALLEMESWHRVCLDAGFTIVTGKDDLEKALQRSISNNFLEVFDVRSQRALRDLCAGSRRDHVSSSILFAPDGTPLQILLLQRDTMVEVVFQNIESRLRSLEHLTIFFRHFLTTPTAICFTDREANILDANSSFLRLYGYRLEEVRGQKPSILKSGRQSPAVYREMWESITETSVGNWSGEIINRCRNGEQRTVHLAVTAVRRSNSDILGFVATSIDISREKNLEEALQTRNEQLVESNRFKSDLMMMTSRDLKTPLDSIISHASLIREAVNGVAHGRIMEHVDRIISDCSRINDFIRNTVDLDQMESGSLPLSTARVHLDTLLKCSIDVNHAAARKKLIRITLDNQAAPHPVLVDAAKMEQVFGNLIARAVSLSPPGSVISVHCRDCPEGKLVEVHDQGPALPQNDAEAMSGWHLQGDGKAPERSFGVGIGLNLARKIVEQHGGTVRACNLPAGGCAFSVIIPTDRPVVSGQDMAVLIHDPSGSIFGYLEELLTVNEVCCFITKTVPEADRILRHERPNMVFVDEGSFTPELRQLLGTAAEGVATQFILVAGQEPVGDNSFFSRTLSSPISETDVLDILRDIRLNHLPPRAPLGPCSILVVDEDETAHEILGEYLRVAGYKVLHASAPEEALRLLTTAPPDLVLLDVRMPEVDGRHMLEQIRHSIGPREVPVVLLSDLDSLNRNEHGMELGGEDFIAKPFNKVELLARVRATLRRSTRYRKIEGALEGNLADVSLPDLLQTLDLGRKTALIRFPGMDGEIRIVEGRFASARQGCFSGVEAFSRLFYLNRGAFTVQFGAPDATSSAERIPLQSLLMETAAYVDEVRLVLSIFPSETRMVNWRDKEGVFPPGLADAHPLLPCPIEDFLVLMKNSLKHNAELIATAHKDNILILT